ncbi:MAG: hypothetical protein ACFB3T_12525 [Geminicoccaceae bacterium]
MWSTRIGAIALAGAAGLGLAGQTVLAQTPPEADRWQFTVAPYIWATGLDGTVATIDGAPPVDVGLSFADVLEDLEFAGFVLGEARKGLWSVRGDIAYSLTRADEGVADPSIDSASLRTQIFTGTLLGGYTFYQDARLSVDANAGVRIWSVESDISLEAGGVELATADGEDSWVDPLLGVTAQARLSERLQLIAAGTVGGFGIGADLDWGITVGASYAFTDLIALAIGWRHLQVDYDNDGFVFDATQSGPLVGLAFRF